MEHLQSVWKDAPAISRSFTVIPLVFHCASWRWSRELDVLKLSLDSFRNEGHYWAIFTAPFWEPAGGGLLQSLFALLVAYWILSGLPRIERAMGSGKLLLWSCCATIAVNVVFLLFALVLDLFYQARSWYSIWPLIPTRGLVPVAIYALTVHSLAAGEAETTLVGIPLKRKHYPLAIVVFFCLLNGAAELGVVAALALGYLRERIQIDAVLPSDGKIQRWERSPVLFFGRRLFNGRWVRITEADATAGTALFGEARLPMQGRPVGRQQAPPEFRAFQGSGHRLGR
ncbi:unnamed protein product [Cladocopium goreaui]|uniref:Derlin n=1 Tax=Cladocopium goreaui TaxID=2562237 RepID=A0A9P1BPH7_9DINO|nr:unnamed protein product [Cladocopium goreaui]